MPYSRFIAAVVLGLMVCAGCEVSESDEEISARMPRLRA